VKNINFEFIFHGLVIKTIYTPKYSVYADMRTDHIEFHVENNTPIPLTKTGYRSEFVNTNKDFTVEEITNWFFKENGEEQGLALQPTLF